MEQLRPSSFKEYSEWYYQRELRESKICQFPDNPFEAMKGNNGKKPQKENSKWHIVLLSREEFENLIFYECDGLINDKIVISTQGLNYRLLRNVAENANTFFYNKLPKPLNERQERSFYYYKAFSENKIQLVGDNRIFILLANDKEKQKNPVGKFYIKDGSGRTLAFMALLLQGKLKWSPVEAFFCESE